MSRPVLWLVVLPFVLASSAGAGPAADSTRYSVTVTNANRIGLTISNYGFFGNNFNSRAPSWEFPLGSAYEHMSRGGLWVGALGIADTGVFVGVSSAIVDNAQGSNSQAETEFSPAGLAIAKHSRLANSRYFSPDAISDEDLICTYSDLPARAPIGYQSERHTPLNLFVRQKILGFSLQAADAFEVVRFTVINRGPPLRDLYLGMYAQLVSGNKNAYATWPPSATSGPGSWYYKTYADYDSSRRLYREHYCDGPPFPDACNFGYCPPWAAVKLLGVSPDSIDVKVVSLNWWRYEPGNGARDTDVERYGLLKNGMRMDPTECVPGGNCSPIMLLSVGPFAQVDPGDSVVVDYAFVAGDDESSLQRNADFAQFASDIDYRLPAPPPSPRVYVESADGRVDVYWDRSPEEARDPTSSAPDQKDFEGYRVYLGLDRDRPDRVAEFDLPDTVGFNTGLDVARLATPRIVDGTPYQYRFTVTGLRNGFAHYGAVTSYDLGDARIQSLESGLSQNKFKVVPSPSAGQGGRGVTVFPNPYRVEARWDEGRFVRDHYLWFVNLPARARISIYSLSGDLVFETRFDGATYRGEGARGLHDPRQDLDTPPPVLSGASYAWNLISRHGQAVASGLYLFSVEDLHTGETSRGKFLLVKSDREQ